MESGEIGCRVLGAEVIGAVGREAELGQAVDQRVSRLVEERDDLRIEHSEVARGLMEADLDTNRGEMVDKGRSPTVGGPGAEGLCAVVEEDEGRDEDENKLLV